MGTERIYDMVIVCHTAEKAKVVEKEVNRFIPKLRVMCISKRQQHLLDGKMYRQMMFHPKAGLTQAQQREFDLLSRDTMHKARRLDVVNSNGKRLQQKVL